ncbi:MAG TPA: hypothetical protein DDW49_04595 [Deltaproteobacteria bacterium]|nr:MAG: hypothetical protein A2048_10885 [Deltaproteobacteria bacterium GWA2_45_12]HBF12659.1 hypothetical protein [Deltaproteobacteria bacterium]
MVPMEIKRNVFNKLNDEITEPFISILLGARQVGKSTLLKKLEQTAQKKGLKTAYFNLELSSDLAQLSGNHKEIFNLLTQKAQVIFIDEFHYLENASKIFKAIYDSQCGVKIFASGSSSTEIHKHLKESLAGRFRKTIIHPLSWDEYQQIPKVNLSDYLQWGGMPGLIHLSTSEEKMDLLENIVSTYLAKDIKALIKEENVRAFNSLLYVLAHNQGGITPISNMAREIGLAEPTLARYLDIMAHTYICFQVTSFSGNLANELKKSRKYYLFDLGIRNSLLKDFRIPDHRDDNGILHESFVFWHLQNQMKPNMEIRFWRTKKGDEVDFIVIKNRTPHPIEVKSTLHKMEIPSGLSYFMKTYPKAPFGIVFNKNLKGEKKLGHRPVYFMKLEEAASLPLMQTVL